MMDVGGDTMRKLKFELMLAEIARRNGTTKEQVRREMQIAMESGMNSADPLVQHRWKRIPKQGEKLTLEEFEDYLATQCQS